MSFNADDFEAVNRYFMQQVQVKTPAAEKVKQEWMRWWKDNKRSWMTAYTQDEWDHARNLRNRFNLANATTKGEKAAVEFSMQHGLSSEEAVGETRRAGTSGMYLEEEEPWIPTKTKVVIATGFGILALGVFAKQILSMTPMGRLGKYLP